MRARRFLSHPQNIRPTTTSARRQLRRARPSQSLTVARLLVRRHHHRPLLAISVHHHLSLIRTSDRPHPPIRRTSAQRHPNVPHRPQTRPTSLRLHRPPRQLHFRLRRPRQSPRLSRQLRNPLAARPLIHRIRLTHLTTTLTPMKSLCSSSTTRATTSRPTCTHPTKVDKIPSRSLNPTLPNRSSRSLNITTTKKNPLCRPSRMNHPISRALQTSRHSIWIPAHSLLIPRLLLSLIIVIIRSQLNPLDSQLSPKRNRPNRRGLTDGRIRKTIVKNRAVRATTGPAAPGLATIITNRSHKTPHSATIPSSAASTARTLTAHSSSKKSLVVSYKAKHLWDAKWFLHDGFLHDIDVPWPKDDDEPSSPSGFSDNFGGRPNRPKNRPQSRARTGPAAHTGSSSSTKSHGDEPRLPSSFRQQARQRISNFGEQTSPVS